MELNPQVFREYDIRGTVDVDLSEDFAYLLGRAYASLYIESLGQSPSSAPQIGVGHDVRHSSPGYARAIAKGLCDEGVHVHFSGPGPTPQLYFTIFHYELGGGIQITGSHNPPDMNGFKICLGKKTISGEGIQDLKARMESLKDTAPAAEEKGVLTEVEVRETYISTLVEKSREHMGDRKLKIVVDGGNGAGGFVGPELLRRLGVDVVELYCEPDGDFPNHHPDPTVPEYLVDLIAKVKEEKADFGVGWDGDADRIGCVDEDGNIIFGDMLLLLYGRSILKEAPGATIIGDVKCSTRLFDDLTEKGAKAIMWKTGHSLIKNKLAELDGQLGGEMSGHIFFRDRFYGFDDALYATARLAELVSNSDGPISALLQDVPEMFATPEIRLDCPEEIKFKIPEKAKGAFSEFDVETIDGVRIRFEEGWGLIRASNTQPVLVTRFEATSQEKLNEYKALVEERISSIKQELGA